MATGSPGVSYEVRLRPSARKELDDLLAPDYERVRKGISALEENRRSHRAKKLAESGLWRIRVGHHRVVYAVDDEAQLVTVVRVARRREDTYKGL
ncbi:MAG: type II toxin-antitoxin system RelE/ParE family toxin [Chloroflexi bacterium]|nr:type II toxin-antitoxin system RelE/ParE family toxin [Chloroflexota bacterium]